MRTHLPLHPAFRKQNRKITQPVTAKLTTRLALLLAASGAAAAQTAVPHRKPKPPQPPYNPNVVLLDPAHGGDDNGASLGRGIFEKDLNQTLAGKLKDALTAQGFTVVLTHSDVADTLPNDQRAELANRSRAVACLILHTTSTGQGIHLFTSSLTPAEPAAPDQPRQEMPILPWDTAQAASVPQSLELASELSTSLDELHVPVVSGHVSIRPIDSLFCPAVTLEIAPQRPGVSPDDGAYQQHIADAVTTALTYWRQHAVDRIAATQAAFDQAAAEQAAAEQAAAGQAATNAISAGKARTRIKPPVPIVPPVAPVVPVVPPSRPSVTPPKPAPIIRRAGPASTTPPPTASPSTTNPLQAGRP